MIGGACCRLMTASWSPPLSWTPADRRVAWNVLLMSIFGMAIYNDEGRTAPQGASLLHRAAPPR